MNALDYALTALLLAAIGIAVFFAAKRSKKGGCCGDCSVCSGCEREKNFDKNADKS